ncbi:unnamed protein product [Phytophthora fragariaefolia]|uniref:Unnamed protein product n=1 Tax=Phytophthora fragariaefolia TaxID=1490495 RepID=A0A9W7CPP3_9STRA|nr:unnamed protein product [Phytophthora fragariaefolia]
MGEGLSTTKDGVTRKLPPRARREREPGPESQSSVWKGSRQGLKAPRRLPLLRARLVVGKLWCWNATALGKLRAEGSRSSRERVAERTPAAPSDETASASRAAPAPTEKQQSSQPQFARAQAQRGSEPPSHRPSLDRSPASSAGAPSDVSIRSSETPRQSPKPPKLPKPATLQSRGSEATPRSYETTFRRDGPPPLVDASGARRWIAERIVDHETRRTRTTDTAPTSRRERTTERYYRIRWLGFPPAEDTWESRERLMEDIPDVVKAYEATRALVFDDSISEDDHDLVSDGAHEYWRGETPGNNDIIATSISDETPANSHDPNSRIVNSRGASSRDHSDDDHATRSVDMDVSAATSSATRSAARSARLSSACNCLARV